ncbi:long-chain-fatty-acid--CoA ligase [Reticulibacter mediterranei]|uniref:Long-chain-fatty-acid--CoA ligase n=1 Tax=Reticulibacter mediterranei TaxID=2778369 RepID=A0A8J3INW4_9CHLR|nr:AMP-binding protein [Reticulibacter mediterranei]GHO95848.1 long-chain-fatty-acid--CoA ligase [Reticulibacter mediterranei]
MTEKMVAPELFRPPLDFPDVPYDHLVRIAAEHAPDRPAIIYHNLILTYREVVSMINCIANGLHELGIRKGECICLFTTNRPEYTLTFIAAGSIGAVVSPMNPAYKEREVTYQLENSEASTILIQRELVPILKLVLSQKSFPHLKHILVTGDHPPEGLPDAIPLATLIRRSSPKYQKHVEISGDDLLALPYSSGTTGLPKGTMLTHHNLTSNNLQFTTALRTDPNDVALLFLPFYHIYGVMLTGSFLACGGTQVLMERFDLLQSLELCEKHKVTYYFAVPPIILALANAPVDLGKLKSLKYIFSGAAPLPLDPARRLQEKTGIQVVQGYGMTEASPLTHSQPGDPSLVRLDSVGMPTHNTEQKVMDIETGERELPLGEDGEIIIRGPQIMAGYWKAPEETARTLRDGWLYTGDIGHIDADGYTYIVDRKKEMIKYKGFGVAPAEIESLLMEHPAVLDSAVIGVPDDEAGELIKGFVVLRKGQNATPNEIITFANGKLAGYKRVHIIEFIDAIPKTASGKILRRDLKEREKARTAQQK